MSLKKCSTIFAILFLYSFSHGQKNHESYIKKAGFLKYSISTPNDTITFLSSGLDKKKDPKPTIVFLQGSLPLPLVFYNKKTVGTILPFNIMPYREKYNFIIIARKGIPLVGSYEKDTNGYLNADGLVPKQFILNDNLTYRTFQAATVLDFLLKQSWVKKDSIYVIGHSEGYRVAAKLAENSQSIAKLVCMSADPFNRTVEEIAKQRLQNFQSSNDSVSQINIDKLTANFRNIGNIEEYKNDPELYNWASYNSAATYESFKKFANPILVVYGTKDYSALHNDLLPFLIMSPKLFIRAYPNLDHNFMKRHDGVGTQDEYDYCWDIVFKDVILWIDKN